MSVTPKPLFRGQPPVSIATPSTVPTLGQTANASATIQAGTYYVKYTWVSNVGGETLPSGEASYTLSAGYQLNVTLPTFPASVIGAKIYISSATGTETLQGYATTTSYSQVTAPTTNTSINGANGVTYTSGATIPTSSTVHVLYTCPNNVTSTFIKGIRLTNSTNAQATLSGIYIVPSGGSYGNAQNILYPQYTFNNYEMDSDSDLVIIQPGDTIRAQQVTAGAITLYISGAEVV